MEGANPNLGMALGRRGFRKFAVRGLLWPICGRDAIFLGWAVELRGADHYSRRMLDLRSTSQFVTDGLDSIELWRTCRQPDRPTDAVLSGPSLCAVLRRLLEEPGNRRVLMSVVEEQCWHSSPLGMPDGVLVERFAGLVERGLIGLAYGDASWRGLSEGGAGEPVTTPVEPVEPLVRPGIDDVTEPTFIAVTLSDDGLPHEWADFTLVTDGTPRPGQFIDDRVHWIEPIDPRARCSITLEHIPVPAGPLHALEVEPVSVEPGGPQTPVPTELSVVVVDQDGLTVPVPLCQVLCDGEPAHEGAFEGTPIRIDDAADDGRYSVALHGLRLPMSTAA